MTERAELGLAEEAARPAAVRAGRLRIVLAAYEPAPLPIHVVYPSTRLLSAKVRAFIELITATCDWQVVEPKAMLRA